MIDIGMKYIGADLAEVELMSLRTLANMTVGKKSSRVPVNGSSGAGGA